MAQHDPRAILSTLSMPLRDIARGLRAASGASDTLMEPAKDLVPAPVRELLSSTRTMAGRVGARALETGVPDGNTLTDAGLVLQGDAEGGSRSALARCLSFGIDAFLQRRPGVPLMVSETVAAVAVQTAFRDADPEWGVARRGAELIRALGGSNAVAPVPGTPLMQEVTREDVMTLASIVAVIWLMTDRAGPRIEDEAELLELVATLVDGMADEILATTGDADALATKLASFAEIV